MKTAKPESSAKPSGMGDANQYEKWPESPKTQRLIVGAQSGDQSAVNQLMDRHRNSLNQLVRMRLDKKIRNRVDVSDVVQNVLIEANRRLPKYLAAPPMPFHLWLRQIAKDRIIDAHRRHRVSAKRSVDREQKMVVPRGSDQPSIRLAAILDDSKLTPAAIAMRKEMARKVEESISLLDVKDSEIIIMRHYEHLSNQEISQILGLTEPAASMRYLRAIRRLREVFQGGSQEGSTAESETAVQS